jgi:hypothetical protein
MRVTCDVLVRQMMEGHQALPFEGCEGAAAAIEHDDNFAVVPCRDEMFQRENQLIVTNPQGSAFGLWHRKCLSREQVLVYKGQPLISTTCLNVAIPVVSPPLPRVTARSKPAVTGACPKGIVLFANAWELSSLPDDLRKRAEDFIVAATNRDSENASNATAYKPSDVSRSLGDELISRIKVRAPITADIRVHLLDPQTLNIVEDLGAAQLVDGIAKIPLADEQRANIVETIWPAYFSSPTVSGGERRLWFFPNEWVKPFGGRWCTMQEHGVYDKRNKS